MYNPDPSPEQAAIPEVSVIMPAYNTAAYIAEAIASALNQTLQPIEVIVVDDASTDGTADVAESMGDPRVVVIRQPQNMGAAVARNRALAAARGRWVAVLDSDDWYAPERLERLLAIAQAEQAEMVADDLHYVEDGQSTPWTTLIRRSGEVVTENQVIDVVRYVSSDVPEKRGLHLGFSKPLIRRDFLVKHQIRYDDDIRLGQDFFIYLDCLAHGARFVLHPAAYYYYRARPGSLVTRSQLNRLEQACQGITERLETAIIQQNPDLVRSLRYKLGVCQRLRAYYRVVEPLKQREFSRALREVTRNPYFFVRFLTQVPRVVIERLTASRLATS